MTQLKALRKNSGLTQQNIADLLGITRGAYANIENGKREPDFAALFTLANHFNVSIDYILGYSAEKKPPTVSSEELDAQDRQLMKLMKGLTADQKEFLLAQLLTLTGQGK